MVRNEWTIRTILCGLVLLLCIALFLGVQFRDLDRGVRTLLELKGKIMQTITQTVTNASGQTATIMTTRLDAEAVDAWLQRHAEAVAAFKAT